MRWSLAVRRALGLGLVAALLASPAPSAPQTPPPDGELVTGIRQLKDGDFEAAVVTLEAVVRRLQGEPARSRDLVEAYVHLGVAEVALDQRDAARGRFRSALALNPQLRLGADRFSPKVLAVFEEARLLARGAAGGSAKGRGAGPIVLAGLAGAATAGVLMAAREKSSTPGRLSFANARFASPVIVCADGADNFPLPFTVVVDGLNGTDQPVAIGSVTVLMRIVSSPGFPVEVGFESTRPARAVPDTLPPRTTTSIALDSTLLCGNAPGGESRFNDWTARVTLATLQGVETLETTGQLRVNLP